MATYVEVPGIGEIEFPDAMSQEEVLSAVQNMSPPTASSNTVPVPGGSVTFPEGMSDQEKLQQINARGLPDTQVSVGGKTLPNPNPSILQEAMTGASNLASGVGEGAYRFGQGVEQLFNEYVPNPWAGPNFVERRNADIMRQRAEYDATPAGQSTVGAVGQFIGEMAPAMAIPGGAAGNLAARAATGAVSGGLQGAAQFVEPGQSRLENTAWGAGLGGGLPVALAGGGKLGDWMMRKNPEARETFALGKQHDVPIMPVDVGGSKGIENYAYFTGGKREKQQAAAKAAAERITGDYRTESAAALGAEIKELTSLATLTDDPRLWNLLDKAEDIQGSDDWAAMMQVGGLKESLARRMQVDRKYDRVEELSTNEVIPTKNLRRTLKEVAAEEESAALPSEGLNNVIDQLGTYSRQPHTFSELRQARSNVRSQLDDMKRGANSVVGNQAVRSMARVRDALETDIQHHMDMSNNAALRDAYEDANLFYKHQVAPYKDFSVAKALGNQDPDEVWSSFIRVGDKKDKIKRLYGLLDDQGKAAARYGMLSEAMQKSVDADTGAFSPAKFSGYLAKYPGARRVMFSGEKAKELNGFTKLMRTVERAGHAGADPMTGNRAIAALQGGGAAGLAAGAMFNAPAAATTATVVAVISALARSPIYRKALVALEDAGDKVHAKEISEWLLQRVLRPATVQAAVDEPANNQTEVAQ